MNPMRFFFAAFALAGAVSVWAAEPPAVTHPGLGSVKRVYLMPMGSGMDQYLAHQLATKGVVDVVTDPTLADAVFTDSLGNAFETRLKELLPPPPPPPPPVEAPKETEKKKKGQQELVAGEAGAGFAQPRTSAFARGKGNVFLVDLKSRSVVWSAYRPSRDRTPREMDRTAGQVADDLARQRGKQ